MRDKKNPPYDKCPMSSGLFANIGMKPCDGKPVYDENIGGWICSSGEPHFLWSPREVEEKEKEKP